MDNIRTKKEHIWALALLHLYDILYNYKQLSEEVNRYHIVQKYKN
jgi:hypothetical protein